VNIKSQREHLNLGHGRKSNSLSDSTLNWFADIPSHWQIKRLQFISRKVQTGTTPPTTNEEYYQNGTIDWFAPSDFLENQIYLKTAKKKLNEKSLQDGIVKCFPRGSILIIGIGATLGKVGLLDIDATSNQQINAILLNKDIEPKFVAYHLSVLQEIMKVISSATTIGILNQEKTKLIPLVIPPLNEQKLIADYLDRETIQIDNLIAAKEQMLTLLEEKREALISHAVTRGLDPNVAFKRSGLDWLGDIPKHWQVCQLKRIWQSNDYGISENIRGDGEIKVLRMTCIEDGIVDLSKGGEVESVDPYLLLRKGDLLFNRTNSLDQVAKVGIVQSDPEQPTTFASYLVRIRTNDLAYPEFLAAYLNSQDFLTFARKNAIPAIGQANLSPSRYGEIKIAIPPKSEQKEILDMINKEQERTKELKNALTDSIALLKERRSALITAAVTGQISIQEMS